MFFFISCGKMVITDNNPDIYDDDLQMWVGQSIIKLKQTPEFGTLHPEIYAGTHTTVFIFRVDIPKITINSDGSTGYEPVQRIVIVQTNRSGMITKIRLIYKQ